MAGKQTIDREAKRKSTAFPKLAGIVLCIILFALFFQKVPAMFQEQSEQEGLPNIVQELVQREPAAQPLADNWPGKSESDTQIDLSSETSSGALPTLYQWDIRWGYAFYMGRTDSARMAFSGCGPTALSMVAVGLTGNADYDPWTIAQYAMEHGHATYRDGTQWTLMSEGAKDFGLLVQEVPLWEQTMANVLQDGKPIICACGPGPFTTGGHFIVLTGYSDGAFTLHDPNSTANTAKTWTYEEISDCIRAMWSYEREGSE